MGDRKEGAWSHLLAAGLTQMGDSRGGRENVLYAHAFLPVLDVTDQSSMAQHRRPTSKMGAGLASSLVVFWHTVVLRGTSSVPLDTLVLCQSYEGAQVLSSDIMSTKERASREASLPSLCVRPRVGNLDLS